MKKIFPSTLALAAVAILMSSVSVRATETDNRIELCAAKSYVFQTYLKYDLIKTESKDGAVTLTGTVANKSQKSMAQKNVASLPGVISVDNKLRVTGERSAGAFRDGSGFLMIQDNNPNDSVINHSMNVRPTPGSYGPSL